MTKSVGACAIHGLLPTLALLALSSCAGFPERFAKSRPTDAVGPTTLDVQAHVMDMADNYIAGLGEAMYLAGAEAKNDPHARWLTMSFLRNGVGAALDIASGPNPNVALLDLMVLSSLQTWSFEHHWLDAGIGREGGAAPLQRLRDAETELWQSAETTLTDEQRQTVRDLINEWTTSHPDRTVTSLVRFEAFADERRMDSASHRKQATGLLADLSSATQTVDDARLLGERLLWFAGRYPYVLGEQMELSVCRMADQPEVKGALEALDSFREVSDTMTAQSESLLKRLSEERIAAFAELSKERQATIEQAEVALGAIVEEATTNAVAQWKTEKTALLEEFDQRHETLGGTLGELNTVVTESIVLTRELAETAAAFDKILVYFAPDPDSTSEPLDMADVRDAAVEASRAAEQLTTLLTTANQLLVSDKLEQRMQDFDAMTASRVDQFFWRGLILILVLLAGLALIRRIPPPRDKSGQ